MEVRLPLPFVITAAGYAEKYGPDERYNYLHFVNKVRCPVLLTLGGVEVKNNMAFAEAPKALASARVPVEVIDGADHFYSGTRTALADAVETWLRARFAGIAR
jgi:alpha/beta superfamily hydrolase